MTRNRFAPAAWLSAVAMLVLFAAPLPAQVGARPADVRLEIVVETGAPVGISQRWLQLLASAGIEDFRLRSYGPGDEIGIRQTELAGQTIYTVTALLKADNTLITPGGRFRSSELGALRAWLQDVARNGPPESRPQTNAWGLTVEQFRLVHTDLSTPVAVSTKGKPRGEIIAAILDRLQFPSDYDAALQKAAGDDPVAEELRGIASGTATAYLLRNPGLCLVPGVDAAGRPIYHIRRAQEGMKIWPVGWRPEKPARDLAPQLYEFLTVNIENVSIDTVLAAVAEKTSIPYLYDHYALVRHDIDPQKAIVSAPNTRTTYSLLLKRLLFQAKLKMELRIDEADQPFLWITSLKPID
ncbi:hypothetical protein JCM19992_03420 [Thermostilla marina]